jgi:hypothetical protein
MLPELPAAPVGEHLFLEEVERVVCVLALMRA